MPLYSRKFNIFLLIYKCIAIFIIIYILYLFIYYLIYIVAFPVQGRGGFYALKLNGKRASEKVKKNYKKCLTSYIYYVNIFRHTEQWVICALLVLGIHDMR